MKKTLYLSIVALICLVTRINAFCAEPVRFGFVDGRSAECVECGVRQWTPFIDYLTREVGVPFEMVLRENYEDLIDEIVKGRIDFYEGGAFSHVSAMETGRADILAGEVKLGRKARRSLFLVRKEDEFNNLSDLKGRKLALTDEYSTSGYILPLIILARSGIKHPESYFNDIIFTGSHERSIRALLEGAVDVAVVGDLYVALLPEEKREKLTAIETSDPIPNGPMTVRKDFDPAIKEKIIAALLDFGKKVPEDIRRITGIDSFFIQDEGAYDIVRQYKAEFEKLHGSSNPIPLYHRMPTVFSDKIEKEKNIALFWMIGSLALLIIPLIFAFLKFRRGISTSAGLVAALMLAVFAVFFTAGHIVSLFSSLDSFAIERLNELENANLRAVTAISEDRSDILNKILLNIIGNDTIEWANIFRNGKIIASSDENEVGESMVDSIRAGILHSSYDKNRNGLVYVQDPIIMNGSRYATLQAWVTFRPIEARVRRAVVINFIVVAVAMITGIVVAVFLKMRLAGHVKEIGNAIERLREGKDSGLVDDGYSEVARVATSIKCLGKELADRQQLEVLKDYEVKGGEYSWDPDVTRELEDKIQIMEAENEGFKRLRMTEAIGQSPAWFRVLRDAAIRARDSDPVMIYGQTGSGKTGIARVIHALSPRSSRPFGEFNCAEFASGDPLVVLGKLFGYGTDSGIQGIAREGQKGILEEFDGRTLFLDEAALLPLQAQQLLLLPLEGRPFNPAAGKGKPRMVDVRFILATNEPLEEIAHSGRIRKDLLRRIYARGIVKIPPLAGRDTDAMLLASFFLARRNAASEKKLSLSKDALKIISEHGFDKYNVSELRGTIDHAFDRALFDNEARIEARHLGGENELTFGLSAVDEGPKDLAGLYDREELRELTALRGAGFNMTLAGKKLGFSSGSKTLTNRFRGLVYSAMDRSGWNRALAAAEIVGPDSEKTSLDIVMAKITDYIATANRNLNSASHDKIFNNLPKKYHGAAQRFLDAIKDNIISATLF